MKAAYLGANPATFDAVYAPKQHIHLAQKVDILEGVFTDPSDSALRGVDFIFSTWGMPACTEREIRSFLPNLKAVFYAAGSVQGFAGPFLASGVRVFSAWKANAVPVAEYTFAQILLALKGYFPVQSATRRARAEGARLFKNYPGAYDVKIGLLGCGAIGSLVAERLKGIDAEVFAYDPFLSGARAEELSVRRADIAQIFSQCDVVSNHLANLPETVGIIRREHLLSMRSYSTFINTGRGPQLDEGDLFDMLMADQTRSALIDVMTDEQNSDKSPLCALENCFITPHIAGSGGREVRRMADYMIAALECVLDGRACDAEVSHEMLKTMA